MLMIKNEINSELKELNFPEYDHKKVVFLGRTSTGKSSLLNCLFGTKQKVRGGRCTT